MKKDRKSEQKKALELKMMKLRQLTAEQLGEVAGGMSACTIGSCNASCGTTSNAA